jgi:uncharacterized SAM-binding protein YcdF (DUF218 family)
MYHFLVWELLQPFILLCLATGIALVSLRINRPEIRKPLRYLIALYVVFVGLSLPATAWLAAGTLEWRFPPLDVRPADAEAIVVLAGAVRGPDNVLSRPQLDGGALATCVEAARLYRQDGACLVVCSGGKSSFVPDGPATADVMKALLDQLGVANIDVLVDDRARTTFENAVQSSKILESHKVHKIVLVSRAIHLFRAKRCFEKLGFEVVACGCDYRATRFNPWIYKLIPSATSLALLGEVCHEWMGSAWYWFEDRI